VGRVGGEGQGVSFLPSRRFSSHPPSHLLRERVERVGIEGEVLGLKQVGCVLVDLGGTEPYGIGRPHVQWRQGGVVLHGAYHELMHLVVLDLTVRVGVKGLEDGGDGLLGCIQPELVHRLHELPPVDRAVAVVVKLSEEVEDSHQSLLERPPDLTADVVRRGDGVSQQVGVRLLQRLSAERVLVESPQAEGFQVGVALHRADQQLVELGEHDGL
jgi:hypothetical protein